MMVGFTCDMQPVYKYARVSLTVKHGPHCWSFSGDATDPEVCKGYRSCKDWSTLVDLLGICSQLYHKYAKLSLV